MSDVPSRRGVVAVPLVVSALLGFGVMLARLEPMRLSRVFLDVGWDTYRGWWAGASALVMAGMIGVLASARVPAMWGRHAAGGAFFLLSVSLAAAEVADPATALAVGGCLGVLAAVAGWVAFGVEGEGGVVWLGAIVAGMGGIVFAAFVGGVLFVQRRLVPYDRALINGLAGMVCGALLAASLRG